MPNTNSISAVLVNYCSPKDTHRCIRSLLSTNELNKIVIVDNSPKSHKLRLGVENRNVILLRNSENLGFGRANNIGAKWIIENTQDQYIFLINNDTTIKKGTINSLRQTLEANCNYAIAGPKIVFMDSPDEIWYAGGGVNWLNGRGKVNGFKKASNNPEYNYLREVDFISGCAMMIRRSAIIKNGLFDPRFFMYEEDLELCLRYLSRGYKLIYDPKGLVFHRVQGSQKKDNSTFFPALHPKNPSLKFYVFHITKNTLLNMHIHAKGIHRLVFCIGFFLYSLKNLILYVKFRRTTSILSFFYGIISYLKIKNKRSANIGLN